MSAVAAELPGRRARAASRLVRQPATIAAVLVLIAVFAAGAFAPQIAPQSWNAIDLSSQWANHAPTLSDWHLFGTDNIGRDVLVRTLYGLHETEFVVLIGAAVATILGLMIGSVAGFYGGWLDILLMRATDLVAAFPAMVLMLAVFALISKVTPLEATLTFAAYMSTFVARIVRARVVSLAVEEFVQAARALGASDLRVLVRHLLPNAAGTVVAAGTSLIGQIALLEATVEFIGFGVSSQVRPTLGNLIADATSNGIGSYNTLGLGWWVWACPALVLVLILVCANLAGDGIDAALNPRATLG